ncbi:MAG TPA: hypothetical protein DHU69_01285, partial [Deltaproteobacteria bacterium]|nr:hypothetical protein [Deltaproteobacteria bacterium]
MDALKDKNNLIILGRWTKEELDRILQEASGINDAGERIEFISGKFLSVDYKESTLIGDKSTPEVFV